MLFLIIAYLLSRTTLPFLWRGLMFQGIPFLFRRIGLWYLRNGFRFLTGVGWLSTIPFLFQTIAFFLSRISLMIQWTTFMFTKMTFVNERTLFFEAFLIYAFFWHYNTCFGRAKINDTIYLTRIKMSSAGLLGAILALLKNG